MNTKLGYAGIGVSCVMPILAALFFITDSKFFEVCSIYNFFWCALYGCVAMWICANNLAVKIILTLLNVATIAIFSLGALMGGLLGELIVVQCLVIPFYEALFL